MESNSIAFNNETMQFRISLDTNTMHVRWSFLFFSTHLNSPPILIFTISQSIHLWVNSLSEIPQWSREELDTLQQFFESKVLMTYLEIKASQLMNLFL